MATLLYYEPWEIIPQLEKYQLVSQDNIDDMISAYFLSFFVDNKFSRGIDRSIDFPLNLPSSPIPEIKNVDSNIGTHLETRARYFWSLNKPIVVLWSGGIDSTAALIALMKTNSNWQESLRIVTDKTTEYPLFYNRYIKPANVLISNTNTEILRDINFYDANNIYINGELADQLFGQSFAKVPYGKEIRFWTLDNICELFINYMWKDIELGSDNGNTQISWPVTKFDYRSNEKQTKDMILSWVYKFASRAPFKITNGNDFLWWCNFVLRWHEKKVFKYVAKLGSSSIYSYMYPFFDTEDLQIWSMTNHDKKFGNLEDWKTYKQPLKDYIYEFTGDADYRDNMIKVGSNYARGNYIIRYCDTEFTSPVGISYDMIPKEVFENVIS
jgi:hypothetical protein